MMLWTSLQTLVILGLFFLLGFVCGVAYMVWMVHTQTERERAMKG